MGRPGGPALLLGAAVSLLGSCLGTSSHFYRTMYTSVSLPSQGLPQFMAVGYADDQLIAHYDSDTRKIVPQISWMKKEGEEDSKYFERYTQILWRDEYTFRGDLVTLRKRYNQSEGFHTVQMMIVCEMRKDGSKGGNWQYGYDGRDFLTFDLETLAWTAADMEAQVIKRIWESETVLVQRLKSYLEETCAEWVQRDWDSGQERLLRKEPPEVKVTRKADFDNIETLICRVGGFYPKEIDIAWTKDGKVLISDTFRGLLSPNSDGTYYTWLSIKIDPKDRERYKCHVEHDGLLKPVDLAWEEAASSLGLIIACVIVGALLLVAGIAGAAVYIKRRRDGYKTTSTSDEGSNSSGRA